MGGNGCHIGQLHALLHHDGKGDLQVHLTVDLHRLAFRKRIKGSGHRAINGVFNRHARVVRAPLAYRAKRFRCRIHRHLLNVVNGATLFKSNQRCLSKRSTRSQESHG